MPKYCEYSKYEQYRMPKHFKYRQYSRVSNLKMPEVQATSRVFNPEKVGSTSSVPQYTKPKYCEYPKYLK